MTRPYTVTDCTGRPEPSRGGRSGVAHAVYGFRI